MKKVAFEFDPFELTGVAAPKKAKDRERALKEAAEFVKTEVLDYVAQSKTPVAGGSFKKTLSPDYKRKKLEEGGSGRADLELSGDMLDALEVARKRGKMLSLQITGAEAPKADGHNNHSGSSKLPERIFIPKEGGNFKPAILSGLKRLLEEHTDEEE